MTGSVIARKNGVDTPLTFKQGDALAGFRLDRRKAWAFIETERDGIDLCEMITWSQHCTGCCEYPEMTTPPGRGSGCHECGYTGRVRRRQFVPAERKTP